MCQQLGDRLPFGPLVRMEEALLCEAIVHFEALVRKISTGVYVDKTREFLDL